MATTIQISNDVRRRLFSFMNQKEKEMGCRITYSEAIKILLDSQVPVVDKDQLIKHVERFQGILDIDDARMARDEERKVTRERERRLEEQLSSP